MIHSTAIISPRANIGFGTDIGPYCVVSGDVTIGNNCKIMSHVTVGGDTEIGHDNVIHPYTVIGCDPQDVRYSGENTQLVVGNNNCFREFSTIHRGTKKGGGVTSIGNDNLFMVHSHVGHDACIGSNCIIGSYCAVAGHVVIDDFCVSAAKSAIKQFVHVGTASYIAPNAMVRENIPPFSLVMTDGRSSYVRGVNIKGMKRAGYTLQEIRCAINVHNCMAVNKGCCQGLLCSVEGNCVVSMMINYSNHVSGKIMRRELRRNVNEE